jgi:hypothetical protein
MAIELSNPLITFDDGPPVPAEQFTLHIRKLWVCDGVVRVVLGDKKARVLPSIGDPWPAEWGGGHSIPATKAP